MQYSFVSIRGVVGNVIRNTRIQDSSYVADMHEWLYEAMEMLHTQQTLEGVCEKITINFHKAKLPCGLKWIDAVEYLGRRLRENGGTRTIGKDQIKPQANDLITTFTTKVDKIVPIENHLIYNTELIKVNAAPWNSRDYYFTDMGTINTSFEDGEITLYFTKVKTDEDGMPMIPDNQNYKQALYWYCRAMMIGSGWEDKQFNYESCMAEFERYAARAISEIRLPSPEQMERRINTLVRLIPHQGYYDSFFRTDRPEGMLDLNLYE